MNGIEKLQDLRRYDSCYWSEGIYERQLIPDFLDGRKQELFILGGDNIIGFIR